MNDPYAGGDVRAPRVQILQNGSPIPGVITAETVSNNYYVADKFTARFALNADPAYGMEFWGSQDPPLLLDFQLSLDQGQSWASMLIGQVDHMVVDPEKGLCEIDGRDLTSYFIDTKIQEAFVSKTSSEIVEYLASKHGMSADVTPTSTPVGRYYGAEHERITQNQFSRVTTEWNLMISLAQHEQYDIWVTGTTVHFHPSVDISSSDPYVVQWVPGQGGQGAWSNVEELRMERSMYMAKDIIVVVRSWDSRSGKSVTKYSPTGARQSALSSGKSQEFAVTVPNYTAADAQDLANRLREQMTRKERLITFSARADLDLDARSIVEVQGTGSSWDQKYWVDSVTRQISQDGGLTMSVHCKNHSPLSSVLSTS